METSQERGNKWLELKYTCLAEAQQLVSQLPAKNYVMTTKEHSRQIWDETSFLEVAIRERIQEKYQSEYGYKDKRNIAESVWGR